ncbi:MAG: class I SAM-dependent methyltransferase [Bacteroidales bacterium]
MVCSHSEGLLGLLIINKLGGSNIKDSQKQYYAELYKRFGFSPEAVASGKQIYKDLRYSGLAKIFGADPEFSVHDIGCGLGHFYEFLRKRFSKRVIEYSGTEIVPEFVAFCEEKYPECKFYKRDIVSGKVKGKYDYVVFGGTFYHLAGAPAAKMQEFMLKMLKKGFAMCRKGMAVNFITSYCEYFYDDLFYCSPAFILDYVVKNLSRYFTLEHNNPLYEFTLCVYKDKYLKNAFSRKEFEKYFK